MKTPAQSTEILTENMITLFIVFLSCKFTRNNYSYITFTEVCVFLVFTRRKKKHKSNRNEVLAENREKDVFWHIETFVKVDVISFASSKWPIFRVCIFFSCLFQRLCFEFVDAQNRSRAVVLHAPTRRYITKWRLLSIEAHASGIQWACRDRQIRHRESHH